MRRKKKAQAAVAVTPDDFLHAAASKVSPLLHSAADRVGPLVQAAADRVGPFYTTAAGRVGPFYTTAAGRVTPLYTTAAGKVTPLYTTVAGKVTPLVITAAGAVRPYASGAAGWAGPYAASAKQRGAVVASGALEKLSPKLEDALSRVAPVLDAARGRVSEALLPRLTEALGTATAAPVVVEATQRGKAAWAAARGDLMLPPPQEIVEVRKSGGVLKWVALASGLVAAAAVVARKFLGSSDADWQAARPSAPYAPPARSATGSPDADSGDFTVADDLAPAGGAELGLGDDVEVGEKPTTGDRTISPSDPITVLADHSDTDSGGANPRH